MDGDFDSARSVYAADVDGDDDMDILGAAGFADDITWWEVTGFDEGRLTSSILDTGGNVGWGVVNWIDDVPDDTLLTVEARASDDPGAMGDWVEITEGDLSDYLSDGLRYLQYRVNLSTDVGDVTPTFNWIQFSWSDDSGVGDVDIFATTDDGGILINW
ncbi:hypothetical protein KAU45_05655, partial [bacterium]|nr:hypothetical protein [bacterium]